MACDSTGTTGHGEALSTELVAHPHQRISEAELRQARQVQLSRSSDQRMVRYQRVQVRRAELREERRRERVRELREAARRHRLDVARALTRWRKPLAAYDITATFGQASPLWSTTHTGVDLAAPTGAPVTAAARGTVSFAADDGPYGNKVVVTHDDGSETWYAHLDSISVTVGQRVANTAVLGTVGSTGNVTGSHLHLELRPGGGAPVDPVAGLAARGVRL